MAAWSCRTTAELRSPTPSYHWARDITGPKRPGGAARPMAAVAAAEQRGGSQQQRRGQWLWSARTDLTAAPGGVAGGRGAGALPGLTGLVLAHRGRADGTADTVL